MTTQKDQNSSTPEFSFVRSELRVLQNMSTDNTAFLTTVAEMIDFLTLERDSYRDALHLRDEDLRVLAQEFRNASLPQDVDASRIENILENVDWHGSTVPNALHAAAEARRAKKPKSP